MPPSNWRSPMCRSPTTPQFGPPPAARGYVWRSAAAGRQAENFSTSGASSVTAGETSGARPSRTRRTASAASARPADAKVNEKLSNRRTSHPVAESVAARVPLAREPAKVHHSTRPSSRAVRVVTEGSSQSYSARISCKAVAARRVSACPEASTSPDSTRAII